MEQTLEKNKVIQNQNSDAENETDILLVPSLGYIKSNDDICDI